jgi:bifunctional polynucleotide phosphatase/kinase
MRFFVPEQIFHENVFKGEKDPLLNLSVASLPNVPLPKHPKNDLEEIDYEIKWNSSNSQELVLFVGPPAAGKTFFYRNYLKDYVHINQDTLKSRAVCMKKASEALDRGHSVVIDNTNPDLKSRKGYVQLARERNVPVRCVVFEVPREICRHNNFYRVFHRDERRTPSIAANVFFSKYEEPSVDEGYQEIIKQKWCPSFESEEEKCAWEMYYF